MNASGNDIQAESREVALSNVLRNGAAEVSALKSMAIELDHALGAMLTKPGTEARIDSRTLQSMDALRQGIECVEILFNNLAGSVDSAQTVPVAPVAANIFLRDMKENIIRRDADQVGPNNSGARLTDTPPEDRANDVCFLNESDA